MSQQKIVSPSFIGHYKLKDLSICDDLIDFHKKDPLQLKSRGAVGTETVGINAIDEEVKKSTDISLSTNEPFISEVCPSFLKYLDELQDALNGYKKEYIYADKVARYDICELINIQHYKPGEGFLTWHKERNDAGCDRHLVFMTYLNDVPDGGTEFYYQNTITKAVKGDTLIWPSDWTHTHKSQVSFTQEKYIITGWYSYIK